MLPFLKQSKLPRIAEPRDPKSYGGDASDKLEEHCMTELMDAVMSHDVRSFRSALEALIWNLFEDQEDADGDVKAG